MGDLCLYYVRLESARILSGTARHGGNVMGDVASIIAAAGTLLVAVGVLIVLLRLVPVIDKLAEYVDKLNQRDT